MPATVTVTGVMGPGNAVTAKVFSNISFFRVDTNNNMLYLTDQFLTHIEVSINAATTVTATKSGTTWTLTIS